MDRRDAGRVPAGADADADHPAGVIGVPATTSRGGRIALTILAMAAALTAAMLLAGTRAGGAPALGAPPHAHTAERAVPAAEFALRTDMRVLWEDHIVWTRMVIVDLAAGLPDLPNATARLLANQADIGGAVATYYGRAAGRRLTGLLRGHILIAADVLTAAKAGDAAALAAAQVRWRANGRAIADFLASANPAWPRAEMRRMMAAHLRLTTAEAVARLTGDWAGDVRAYDRVHRQALHMADMLSAGIVRQFPGRFAR